MRLALQAAAAASISVDTATRVITSAGAYQTKIGSVDLGSKPVDWQLQGTSSWINLVNGRDRVVPKGWSEHAGK